MSAEPRALEIDFSGDIIEPQDAAYASVRDGRLVAGAPRHVLRPRDVADVRAAVRFAAASGLPLAVRGGGHSFSGASTNDGGIVIDLALLDGVEVVDAARGLVRVGGGATWGPVADALAVHGLALSSGDTRSVGVGGLTLGGGIGWKVRAHGLALDSLVAAEVVLASGELVRADAASEPELFWALRGGGGELGVVTAFEFVAHPSTDVFFGRITFPAGEAGPVLSGWASVMSAAPEALTSVVNLAHPFLGGASAPVEVVVMVDGDDPAAADAALAPIRRLGTALSDDVALTPYAAALVEAPPMPPGVALVTRNGFVETAAVPSAMDVVARIAAGERTPMLSIRALGGAVARVEEAATAFAHRRAELMVVTTTAGPVDALPMLRAGLDAAWERLAAVTRGAYLNFLSEASAAELSAVHPLATAERLGAVARRYDPAGLFGSARP